MFQESKFKQNISNWDIKKVEKHDYMFEDCPMKNKITMQPKFKN